MYCRRLTPGRPLAALALADRLDTRFALRGWRPTWEYSLALVAPTARLLELPVVGPTTASLATRVGLAPAPHCARRHAAGVAKLVSEEA
eukprot:2179191-Pyramimonas_sp.AAC.1